MDYILGIFLKENTNKENPTSMLGVKYHTLDSSIKYVEKYLKLGIKNFLVFPSTNKKSVDFACEKGIVKNFIMATKKKFGDKVIIHADVGLSPYTPNGDSVIFIDGKINYEETYAQLSKLAISFARAGADYVCPVIPFEDQVSYIRSELDKFALEKTKIHSYSAKFSSSLYGPYFIAVQATIKGSSKRSYYLNPDNSQEALKKITNFQKQGADIVMVKPAMIYLDVIYQAKKLTKKPLSVYHVSGEYSMIKSAAKLGFVKENEAFDEIHSAFRRAGADYVIGYAPDHFLRWLKEKK